MGIVQEHGRWRSIRTPAEKQASAISAIGDLNAKERLALSKILEQMGNQGFSPLASEIAEVEWDEQPMPVADWLMSEDHVGETGKDMYQQLRSDLIDLFEGDYHEAILCLHPDTRVPLLDGSAPTLADLAEIWKTRQDPFLVYSRVGDQIVPRQAVQPRQTGVDDYYRVTLDDGSSFVGNARHQMIMRDGSKRMIRDMHPADVLPSFGDTADRSVVYALYCGHGPVYCLSVPDSGNFAIVTDGKEVPTIRRSGVFSSNTGAIGW